MDFYLVDPEEGRTVWEWHSKLVKRDNHLFPRSLHTYQVLASQGYIWCARDERGYVGVSYFVPDDGFWEIGGLTVIDRERHTGVGTILALLTIGHLLMFEDPLSRGERIIAHVHAENRSPIKLLADVLRFRLVREFSESGSKLPGLKQDAAGLVRALEYELSCPETLLALATWCDDWKGVLANAIPAKIDLTRGTDLKTWAAAFRDLASKYPQR